MHRIFQRSSLLCSSGLRGEPFLGFSSQASPLVSRLVSTQTKHVHTSSGIALQNPSGRRAPSAIAIAYNRNSLNPARNSDAQRPERVTTLRALGWSGTQRSRNLFTSTYVLRKDKSDIQPRGFAGPRKSFAKNAEEPAKKPKTPEEKEKRKQEREEREKLKKEVRKAQVSRKGGDGTEGTKLSAAEKRMAQLQAKIEKLHIVDDS